MYTSMGRILFVTRSCYERPPPLLLGRRDGLSRQVLLYCVAQFMCIIICNNASNYKHYTSSCPFSTLYTTNYYKKYNAVNVSILNSVLIFFCIVVDNVEIKFHSKFHSYLTLFVHLRIRQLIEYHERFLRRTLGLDHLHQFVGHHRPRQRTYGGHVTHQFRRTSTISSMRLHGNKISPHVCRYLITIVTVMEIAYFCSYTL